MLETVKAYVDSVEDIPFNHYFVGYIMKVQDANIENEVSTLLRHHTLNIYVMDKLLDTSFKGLVSTC